MKYPTWVLNENETAVKPAFTNYEEYASFMKERGVEFNINLKPVESFIKWDKYPEKYSFWYYYEGCERDVSRLLSATDLINYDFVYMDMGQGDSIYEIQTTVFIEKWINFVFGALFETTVVSPDGRLVMEFRKGDMLFSNFKIED